MTVAAANGRALLAAIDENASAAGLVPGMVLADARALVPDLAVRPSHPDKDAAALAQLADWCARFSPWVAVDGADGLFLDITGCAHLFGGEARMIEEPERTFGVREDSEISRNEARGQKRHF